MSFWLVSRSMDPKNYMTATDAVIQVTVLFAKVIAAIERLKSYQIEFNTLTVINNINVHYPLEVYHFLKSIGSKHMQFIELLETGTPNIDFSGHSENTFRIIDFSVPPTAYGKFMSTIFMQWVKNDVGEIFIRQFESFVSRFLGNGHTSCIFQESCKDNLVVESNGDIYECDHFVYPQYKIGNINKSELKTMNSVQLTAQKNGFQRNVSNVYINLSAMVVALSIVLLK